MHNLDVVITSDGTGPGSSVKTPDGKDVPGCFAFEIRGGRMRAFNTAVLYCHQTEVTVHTKADVVLIPTVLVKVAQEYIKGQALCSSEGRLEAMKEALAYVLGVQF